jgi:transcriptional regulator with XRE-family HTH domain
MSYGEFISKHRLLSGYKSQRRLADKSGISSATLSRIEAELQKPLPETLKQLAPFLTSTSLVELMVVCGYWDKEDLLDDESDLASPTTRNEREFLTKTNLSDEELLEEFELLGIDGEKLTRQEAEGIIAYVRTLRHMKKN